MSRYDDLVKLTYPVIPAQVMADILQRHFAEGTGKVVAVHNPNSPFGAVIVLYESGNSATLLAYGLDVPTAIKSIPSEYRALVHELLLHNCPATEHNL